MDVRVQVPSLNSVSRMHRRILGSCGARQSSASYAARAVGGVYAVRYRLPRLVSSINVCMACPQPEPRPGKDEHHFC